MGTADKLATNAQTRIEGQHTYRIEAFQQPRDESVMLKSARNDRAVIVLMLAICLLFLLGCGSEQQVERPTSEVTPNKDRSLADALERARSDDAATLEEVYFHAEARATVIRHVEPNKLGVGGAEFRVKRNPIGRGAFIHDPRVKYFGVTRLLVWWVPERDAAYPLNSPSKMVTPGLEFPGRAGLLDYPDTSEVVGYVFRGEPMTPPAAESTAAPIGSFNVREYQMYRGVIDTPMSVSDEEAYRRIAEQFDTTPEDVGRIVTMVEKTLSQNGWFGFPKQEIRRASDY